MMAGAFHGSLFTVRWAIASLFAFTYIGISSRRLQIVPVGRPAMALLGAVTLMVVGTYAGPYGLSVDEGLRSVEPNTIALLFGMMLISVGLDEAGFFAWTVARACGVVRSGSALLWIVTFLSGILSAFLVNDAVCLLATPVVVTLVQRLQLPIKPYLFALAMGSNSGSAMTLSGNPQNMLVARLSGLSYKAYLIHAFVPSMVALTVTAGMLHYFFRREIAQPLPAHEPVEPISMDRTMLSMSLLAVGGVVLANVAGASLALSALCGACLVLFVAKQRAESLLGRVDWSVLLFFSALFVVVAALQKTGLPLEWLQASGSSTEPISLVLVISLGSQVVSNVPLILLLQPWIDQASSPMMAWELTAMAATLAGNLTLLGSVANIIVLERAKVHVGFVEYLKIGVPVTTLSLVSATGLFMLANASW